MPVIVFSGFLGAGKTTFLNTLLAGPALQDSMIIVNEYGDAGLDSLFLEAEGAAKGEGLMVEELTSGCLCCTLQGPLVQTLEDLLRARDNGRIAPFKQLVIETTGLADPGPILGAFARHPYLSLRYLVGGIVTVVDAAQEPTRLDESPEAVAQIAVADVLALSKTDLVDGEETDALRRALTQRNPDALLATTAQLGADTNWLQNLLDQVDAKAVALADHAGGDEPHHHAHHHDHDHHHAYSQVVETSEPVSERALQMFMDLLAMNFPGDLLRVKGIAWIAGEGAESEPSPWAVHAAGPLQHPARPLSDGVVARLPDTATRIVVITRTDQNARIVDLFEACLRQA